MRNRHPALDNAVFGLAVLLFLVIAYYAVQQLRKPAVQGVPGPSASTASSEASPVSQEARPAVDSLPALKVSKPGKPIRQKRDVPIP